MFILDYRNYKSIFFTGEEIGLQVHVLQISNLRALLMLFLKLQYNKENNVLYTL